MSSVLRTIDALKEVHVGDYVEFHKGRLGYVEEITKPDTVLIVEDDGMTQSRRPRRYNVKQYKVAVVPKSGNSYTNNRNLIHPPEPYESTSDTFSEETKQLIYILKKNTKVDNELEEQFTSFLKLP